MGTYVRSGHVLIRNILSKPIRNGEFIAEDGNLLFTASRSKRLKFAVERLPPKN